jgi:hypothetical protein
LLQKVPCIFFVVLFIYGWKFWIKLILHLSIWFIPCELNCRHQKNLHRQRNGLNPIWKLPRQ